MGDVTAWIQTNWQELTTFLVEVAFLIAAVWFARNVLKALRAFQEQMGALLKLTITPSATERENPPASARSSLAESSPYWLTPSEAQTEGATQEPTLSEPVESGPIWIVRAWHGITNWMNAPIISRRRVGPWHRLVSWLRSPAGN